LGLKEGDDIEVRIVGDRTFEIGHNRTRAAALDSIRRLRRPLPAGWVFDRDEASER
jgi:antitoxin MazE